ncbi:bifunctional metallophosphatase/5'-nucleotidase [Agromyces atrinae]|uniref:choice-of-anchor I family protein n=1 Tax=Agromyces atrinae TaxID=592376 RepID=UPI001F5AD314|nr:choice-of-anchor I family protein [Agromyces atrinae]MCI2958864.1 bifunctional metallophosphatase/5'-nucleotidase [Agromyces atrinae]
MSVPRSRTRSLFLPALGGVVAVAACLAAPPALAAPAITVAASTTAVAEPIRHSADDARLSLTPIGTYESGVFDESAAEIVAYHGERLYVVNAQAGAVDVLDVSDPTTPVKLYTLTGDGVANSVAIRADGLGVVALENPVKTDPGSLLFFDADSDSAAPLGSVSVGALPDMVTLSEDGSVAVVANEGEPNDDFTIDPEGSIGVVSLPSTVAAPQQSDVRIADFHEFEAAGSKTLHEDVRVFGPTPHGDDLPVSRNLEPEYIAIDGGTAYAALQEANAVAVVDLATATVTDIHPLGFADHGQDGHGIDPSDRDSGFDIRTVPGLRGIPMPDGMQAYRAGDTTYLVTANEGDAREWGDYVEGTRAKSIAQNGRGPVCADSPLAGLLGDADLGRLNVTTENGFDETTGCYTELYAFGTRSFSIWTTSGEQVFDSGEDFERITNAAAPEYFNSNHSESNFEGRSDDKGPEPEGITIGQVGDRTYAFIGFERVGGIAVYDITDPVDSTFVTYVNNRDFTATGSAAGDLGPEGLTFIPSDVSPTGVPLLAVGNEVSGTTTLFEIEDLDAPATTTIDILTVNDFHGRLELAGGSDRIAGAAVLAGAVDTLRAENPNTIFASAGDAIGASTFTSFSQQDNPTIDALIASSLDVGAVGNHEFDAGWSDLEDRVIPRYGDSRYALGANVYAAGTTTPVLDEYWITEKDGVSVAFIGTVTPDTANMVDPAGIADIEFGDQLEAANRVATQLSDGDSANGEADVIVLLAHDGNATTSCDDLAASTSDFGALARGASASIDAIVSAHTHQVYSCSFAVDGWAEGVERPVIQAGQYGSDLGRLTLEVDPADGRVLAADGAIVPLHDGTAPLFPENAEVAAIVAAAVAEAETVGARPIGTISGDILRGGTPSGSDRGVESSLGNLIADQQLWATSNESFGGTPAQIALMNPGGVRADLIYGTDGVVTYRDVAETQPFGNTLVTMDLTGAQLKSVLEEQWQPDGSSRPKLHLGVSEGFSYVYEPDAARGEHIVSMSFEGAAIESDDVFRVAVNSFLAGGGDNFSTLASGANRADTGQIDLVAAVSYFQEFEGVDPAPLGRAVVAGTDWADVALEATTLSPGDTLKATVTGLTEGQQITATLYSQPIVAEVPAADATGSTSFEIAIPADIALGAHRLVIDSVGLEPIEVAVTVVAAEGPGGGPGAGPGTPGSAPTPGDLASTGVSIGAALAVVVALLAGGLLLLQRRRRSAATDV